MHTYITKASQELGVELPALKKAATVSTGFIDDYKDDLKEILNDTIGTGHEADLSKADIVMLGSVARQESSAASDFDYYILQNGAHPEVTRDLINAAKIISDRYSDNKKPGSQGVFGRVVVAPNLYESIGLEADSNANMTRRILLLTESLPITQGKTYKRVFTNIIDRYCSDYLPPNQKIDGPVKIPRFLLNDLVRFWRTMAVDFGTKRWQMSKDETNVRLLKLLVTRKILFAGPLATLLLVPRKVNKNENLCKYLIESFKVPPLAQLAGTYDLLNKASKEALKDLLVSYDSFLQVLSSDKDRKILNSHDEGKGQQSETWKRCKKIGEIIQNSLEMIFCDDELFKENFRRYSVF